MTSFLSVLFCGYLPLLVQYCRMLLTIGDFNWSLKLHLASGQVQGSIDLVWVCISTYTPSSSFENFFSCLCSWLNAIGYSSPSTSPSPSPPTTGSTAWVWLSCNNWMPCSGWENRLHPHQFPNWVDLPAMTVQSGRRDRKTARPPSRRGRQGPNH